MRLSSIMKRRGALIVVEGVDRSGKSTQCNLLTQSLKARNYTVQKANFPDRTTAIGNIIDQYLKQEIKLTDEAVHLLFSANRWEKMHEIQKSLAEGTTWIIDRYSYSGIIFSSIKKNMSFDWCKMPESGLPEPDLTFLLMVDDETLAQRPGFGNEIYEKTEIQRKVKHLFKKVYNFEPTWEIIDASKSKEEVHDKMLDLVIQKIREVEYKPLKFLKFLPDKNILSY
ncbi:uncharacterized protein LOC109599438 isoform X2 [Aethina tumida]|uniref:uncharacterized protein LOC109599438 isoform X2 n=1 Tax=Aethina tumida TaxID=116153 RepID=UPI00096B0C50|nr:uncharacterized protein LOC109599438 isoform X2 [Aethina tumida]